MSDPVEVRWSAGSVRLGYVGDGRWRRGSSIAPLREIVDAIAKTILASPGRVEFVAPGVEDVIEVVRRDDLIGVLPAGLVPLDVTSPTRQPFVAFAMHWLDWHSERCWADDVARPADRFGAEFSSDAFASSTDRAALAAKLDAALDARVAAAKNPVATFEKAIRELAALGHTSTFADGNGTWSLWSSQWIDVSFEPPRSCSVTAARVEPRSE